MRIAKLPLVLGSGRCGDREHPSGDLPPRLRRRCHCGSQGGSRAPLGPLLRFLLNCQPISGLRVPDTVGGRGLQPCRGRGQLLLFLRMRHGNRPLLPLCPLPCCSRKAKGEGTKHVSNAHPCSRRRVLDGTSRQLLWATPMVPWGVMLFVATTGLCGAVKSKDKPSRDRERQHGMVGPARAHGPVHRAPTVRGAEGPRLGFSHPEGSVRHEVNARSPWHEAGAWFAACLGLGTGLTRIPSTGCVFLDLPAPPSGSGSSIPGKVPRLQGALPHPPLPLLLSLLGPSLPPPTP